MITSNPGSAAQPKRQADFCQVTDEKRLFQQLFERLDRAKPQVFISPELRRRMDRFKEAILEDDHVSTCPVETLRMCREVYFNDPPDWAKRCGLWLLDALISISSRIDPIVQIFPRPAEPIRIDALTTMVLRKNVFKGGIELFNDEGALLFRSTRRFEARYRLRVNVRVPLSSSTEDARNSTGAPATGYINPHAR